MKTTTSMALALLTAASLTWAGCAGEPVSTLLPVDPANGSGSTGSGQTTTGSAQAFFEAEVYTLLIQDAECGLCHGPGGTTTQWLEATATDSYMTIEAFPRMINPPDCSYIIEKSSGQHSGNTLSPSAEAKVIEWLTMEAAARSLSCEGQGPNPSVLDGCDADLAAFQACMSFNFWETLEMGRTATQQTLGSGACYGCHNGIGGVVLTLDSQETFDAHKNDKYVLQKLVTCAISQGNYQGLVPSLRYLNKGTEPCVSNPCHPEFVMSPERETALYSFVDDTIAALAAGTCADLDVPPPMQ